MKLHSYVVVLEAKPTKEARLDFPVLGYYQQIGVSFETRDQMLQLLREHLRNDLGSFVNINQMWIPDFEGDDKEILERSGDRTRPGIWYTSGRAFFDREDE